MHVAVDVAHVGAYLAAVSAARTVGFVAPAVAAVPFCASEAAPSGETAEN